MASNRSLTNVNKDILHIALPALGALIAEPLFILTDSAFIGRVGKTELAGLSLAANILTTIVGLCVFLAYATTTIVAFNVGRRRPEKAFEESYSGLWLAFFLGAVLTALLTLFAGQLCGFLSDDVAVIEQAKIYLRISALGIPAMLCVLAATGALRGFKEAKTTFWVASLGAIANIALSFLFIYGFSWSLAGSAGATAVCQTGMALALIYSLHRLHQTRYAGLAFSRKPYFSRILTTAKQALPLLIRTLGLRGAILLTVWVASSAGVVVLATHQIISSLWSLMAFVLDSLAIAAQTLIAQALGERTKDISVLIKQLYRWVFLVSLGLTLLLFALSPLLPELFSTDADIQEATWLGIIVIALLMPLAAWVFILDGILIGAGQTKYLAYTSLLTVVFYIPVIWFLKQAELSSLQSILWLWGAFGGYFMLLRAAFGQWGVRYLIRGQTGL